ncbi:UvrD-helicase domain-containing protein [Tessaracoccus sp. OS52]|uniref:UvrD-helicase domain-containing protein n=1 Tax=Tessaracoccus sp. OS52 TaxID=2886691 RepID=UPI001D1265E8|nr:UvrD-helicase domain-containing protein [Tessaracoccus sp. OS52]MCC2593108.1 UvrD-helicase domain-containing protein [Tessaracoccus sp. OS52]
MFDFRQPLPTSPLLLEASAGTGKTWAIATLTARFVAEEGTPIDEVLLITFTERSARDLRSRVFQRLQAVEQDLTLFLESGQLPDDEVSALICTGDVELRADRLRRALENFDRSMISTIHAFCESMLRELGVLGDWDAEDTVLTDPRALIEQCATDVYLTRYSDVADLDLTPKRALEIAQRACESTLPLTSSRQLESEYCEAVRARFASRKRELGVVAFDDMPVRLSQLLSSRQVGPVVAQELRDRFRLVMVDEFQDTDPVQWDILRGAFLGRDRATVLIGDPKQSIYGFRNADLLSYLEASETATKQSLGVNFRSDRAVVDGVGELFGNVTLGDQRITVQPVVSRHESRLEMRGAVAKVLVRCATEDELGVAADTAISRDLVSMTNQLLAHAEIEGRPLVPSDIAVLVRSRAEGKALLTQLERAGIPAVAAGQENVLETQAASDWTHVLGAMTSPTRSSTVLAACTDLLGFDLAKLIDDASGASEQAFVMVRSLANAFDKGGFAAVLTTIAAQTDLHRRLMSLPDGPRRLTDLLHVGELLSCAPASSLQDLVDWFAKQLDTRSRDVDSADHRMASDADAVRVLTLHSAKGLEFGVVLLPEVSELSLFPGQPFPLLTDEGRRLYVGPKLDRQDQTRKEYERQLRDEELRLLYVGLTRAKHLAIAWHVESRRSSSGPLTALLARDRANPMLAAAYSRIPRTPPLDSRLVSVTRFHDGEEPTRSAPEASTSPLTVSRLTREVDRTWRRTSYSGLTAGLHEFAHAAGNDEPEADLEPQAQPTGAAATPSPMAELPGGASFGTLVHAVLEQVDWAPAQLQASAEQVVGKLAPRHGLAPEFHATLTSAVIDVCTTRLGPVSQGASLSELPLADRLAELDFDLPMADRGSPADVAALAAAMGRHLPDGDALAAYPRHLAQSPAAPQVLNGMLTGSIDVVVRTPAGGFVVIDYKTNRLPVGPGEDLAVGHYNHRAMAEAMIQSHYPLQALLYCVALHRYLTWRLPGYEPGTHLGGVAYLFVRGMAGPATPVIDGHTCGVFTWHPSAELVLEASRLIGGTR